MVLNNPAEIVITCPPRQSWLIAQEVGELGYTVLAEDHQSVTISGSLEDCMKLNLELRCANRVLLNITRFKAEDPDTLYNEINKIAWEKLISPDGYICINSFVRNDRINDTRFANLKVKDAIVDRMQEKIGRRPDAGSNVDKTVFFLHWVGDNCGIYIDTSGETISKHGYRRYSHKAPLLESLASGILRATAWNRKSILINPMCGSGTLAIEAALWAQYSAPGLNRRNFGFMHIIIFNRMRWNEIREEALARISRSISLQIIATDISANAVESARKNAKIAGVDGFIEFRKCAFEKTPIPDGEGLVILNPEYGVRLGEEDALEATYLAIGDFFKQKCQGKTGFIFTGNLNLAKKVGLKAKRRIEFFNGKIDCRLLEYELYGGSKKISVGQLQ